MSIPSAPDVSFLGTNLERWARKYGHSWIETYDKSQQVLVEGKLQDWSQVASKILKGNKLNSNWRYDHSGFHQISAHKWKKLEPTDQREATGHCYFEVISRELGCFGQSRHCYMRLVNEQGQVHSIGFCGQTGFPLAWQRGSLISPDPKEVETEGERVTRIQIDPEKYTAIFNRFQSDKQAGKEAFHLIHRNCSAYTAEILAEHLGIELNNQEFVTEAFQRKILASMGLRCLPTFMRVVFTIIGWALQILILPLAALFYVVLGGCFVRSGAEHRQAYEATFGERTKTEGVWKKIAQVLYSVCTAGFLKPFTGWRVSLWQDRLHAQFSYGTVSVSQAQSVRLSDFLFEDARNQGQAFASMQTVKV